MGIEIIKVYVEQFPRLRFIGKRYKEDDNFGKKWGEWHRNGWFDEIEKLGAAVENDDGYIGAKRVYNGALEYWIGMLFPENTTVPDDFEHVDICARRIATCWVRGKSPGELSGSEAHKKCLEALSNNDHTPMENDWCFERYNCPRFIDPDENGNIILDYCLTISG